MDKKIKVALIHDFLTQWGGAERVLEALSEIFPEAPIYTLLYDAEMMRGKFEGKNIRTSFLQKSPRFVKKRRKVLLPLMPIAPEIFDLRDFDIVISSSGAWTKGIVTKLDTIHFAYVHSPMRFVWDYNDRYLKENRKEHLGFLVKPFLSYLRVWDKLAADRPDYLIANSVYTQRRISKYYRRDSSVVYPPIDDQHFENDLAGSEKEDYFLVVSRLSAYKKVDLVVETFNKLGLPLVVIGEGNQEKELRKMARDNVMILGWQDAKTVAKYYAKAKAFIFPAEDDLGLTAVEAMSYGVPVVGLERGGMLEIIEEGKTGEFFSSPRVEILADGVRRLMENEKNYDRDYIKNKSQNFSKYKFKENIEKLVRESLADGN